MGGDSMEPRKMIIVDGENLEKGKGKKKTYTQSMSNKAKIGSGPKQGKK